ncbi:WbuC family cupin fold metalloprotein [uncultured Tolumonas sp.]|uniref:WbuC family cupin fold metalloprotein n=1 Tax=uncultured Tolumonas sp. TaxID=263765 RepID=UPI00292D18E5|nr:WbuC family cupin fold metalloprotein [uncultured Tolumonas sp.]
MIVIGSQILTELTFEAKESQRKRTNLNIHESHDDIVHKLFIAMEPDTYVKPHRHKNTWEYIMIVSGSCDFIVFNSKGVITDTVLLGDTTKAVEIESNTWHTVVCHEPNTILFEVKMGPYKPLSNDDMASWSPPQYDARVPAYVNWLKNARVGDDFETIEMKSQ